MRAISFASWLTRAAAAVLLASSPVRGIAADSLYQRIGGYDAIAVFVDTASRALRLTPSSRTRSVGMRRTASCGNDS